jgi:tetratricopeptide (TPR) repeat protein
MKLERWLVTLYGCLVLAALPAKAASFAEMMAEGKEFYDNGLYRPALRSYEKAYRFAQTHLSEENVSKALHEVAQVLYMQGELDTAYQKYVEVAEIDGRLHGADSIEVADDLDKQMRALRRMKRFEEAEPLIRQVLEVRQRVYGANHRLVANTWLDLAVDLDRINETEGAERCYRQALSIREQLFGVDDKQLMTVLDQYKRLLIRLGRTEEADALGDRSRRIHDLPTPQAPAQAQSP